MTTVGYGRHRSSAVRFGSQGDGLQRMKRASVILLLVLLALMAVGPLGPAPVSAASRTAPKVVLVVGPVGSTTPYYKRLADQAAASAAKYTPNVVKVYSPEATWTNVKRAMQGASIV